MITTDKPWNLLLSNGASWTLPPGEYIFEEDGGQPGWFDVFTVKGEPVGHVHIKGKTIT